MDLDEPVDDPKAPPPIAGDPERSPEQRRAIERRHGEEWRDWHRRSPPTRAAVPKGHLGH